MGEPAESQVAVIGGGCAGLAAAAQLAEQGQAVTLFEASPQLGGRARGVQWKGLSLDNGQHILLGAYRDTLRMLQLAGVNQDQA
ncbi:MAG TPA: FAD-dependent oxidoreductase, partial [Methylophilaceae bacterium]|nr:FAD-dependent oxidoreductase [Methylophilaceae bacterium]